MRNITIPVINKTANRVGLGTWAVGGTYRDKDDRIRGYGPMSEEKGSKIVSSAIDQGVNVIDTSPSFGLGQAEKCIGNSLVNYDRDDFVVISKFGIRNDHINNKTADVDLSPHFIRKSLSESLERLKTDYLDIYLIQQEKVDNQQLEAIFTTLNDLVEGGLILSYGWNTDLADELMKLRLDQHFTAVEFAMHLTRINPPVMSILDDKDLIGIVRSPLASGTLTGKYDPLTKRSSDHMISQFDFSEDKFQPHFDMLRILHDYASDLQIPLSQVCLSYMLTFMKDSVLIPGASSREQVKANTDWDGIRLLSRSEMDRINKIVADCRWTAK